jgi:protocatechuate 3,4-dioxygenase beta subunit
MTRVQKIIFLLITAGVFSLHADDLARFSGTVVDAQGKAVADAVVECFHFPAHAAVGVPEIESKQFKASDTNGGYEFSVPSGAVTVVAKKAGFASGWKTWQSSPSGVVDPLVLTAPSMLGGMVVDENGRPVTNAMVSVSAAAEKKEGARSLSNFLFGKAARDLFSAATSADGRFRILNFPTDAQATLTVSAPGRALRPTGTNGMQLQRLAGQDDIKLVTDPAASIEGKVVFRDTGAPVANARIQLAPVNAGGGISSSPPSAGSGADGSFRVVEVPAGSYRVIAISTNQPLPLWVAKSVPVTVATGETARDVKIQAFKGGIVELTAVGKDGERVLPGADVSAYSEGYPVSGVTGPGGVAWFRLPPGEFMFFGAKPGVAQAQTQATVTEGETNRVKLELDLPPQEIAMSGGGTNGAPHPALPMMNPLSRKPEAASSNVLVAWPGNYKTILIVLLGIAGVLFWMMRKRKP